MLDPSVTPASPERAPAHAEVAELGRHDRFVVTRRRSIRVTPSLGTVDSYECALADAGIDTPAVCHVRRRASRWYQRIVFHADASRSVALMYLLNPRPRFDPWARHPLVDGDSHPIGEIQKAFGRRGLHYLLYDGDGDEVARVEAHVSGAARVRRVIGVAVAAALSILLLGGVEVAALLVGAAVRQMRAGVDPIFGAPELHILRVEQTLGVIRRRLLPTTFGPSPVPLPWRPPDRLYDIDMSADPARTVDRRLVLAIPVALDALHGVFADSALR